MLANNSSWLVVLMVGLGTLSGAACTAQVGDSIDSAELNLGHEPPKSEPNIVKGDAPECVPDTLGEECDNGIDDDCDELVDENDPDCDEEEDDDDGGGNQCEWIEVKCGINHCNDYNAAISPGDD